MQTHIHLHLLQPLTPRHPDTFSPDQTSPSLLRPTQTHIPQLLPYVPSIPDGRLARLFPLLRPFPPVFRRLAYFPPLMALVDIRLFCYLLSHVLEHGVEDTGRPVRDGLPARSFPGGVLSSSDLRFDGTGEVGSDLGDQGEEEFVNEGRGQGVYGGSLIGPWGVDLGAEGCARHASGKGADRGFAR